MGWNRPTVLPEMANAVEFAKMWNAGVTNANSSRLYSDEKIKLLEQYMNDPIKCESMARTPCQLLDEPSL